MKCEVITMPISYENRNIDISSGVTYGLSPVAHLHNHIEIIIMLEGETVAQADSAKCVLSAGDVFISFPNQVHYYNDLCKVQSIIIIFAPELCAEFQSIFKNKIP